MRYSPKQYAESLYDLLKEGGEQSHVIRSFVGVLRKNGDIGKAQDIMRNFESVWYDRQGKVKVEVTVARGTPQIPKKIAGKEVDLKVHHDESVVGGMKLTVGDFLIDATLKQRLNALAEAMAQ